MRHILILFLAVALVGCNNEIKVKNEYFNTIYDEFQKTKEGFSELKDLIEGHTKAAFETRNGTVDSIAIDEMFHKYNEVFKSAEGSLRIIEALPDIESEINLKQESIEYYDKVFKIIKIEVPRMILILEEGLFNQDGQTIDNIKAKQNELLKASNELHEKFEKFAEMH